MVWYDILNITWVSRKSVLHNAHKLTYLVLALYLDNNYLQKMEYNTRELK